MCELRWSRAPSIGLCLCVFKLITCYYWRIKEVTETAQRWRFHVKLDFNWSVHRIFKKLPMISHCSTPSLQLSHAPRWIIRSNLSGDSFAKHLNAQCAPQLYLHFFHRIISIWVISLIIVGMVRDSFVAAHELT